MALIAGAKQTISGAILAAGGVIGYIKDCLGAKAIVLYAHNATQAGTVTFTAKPSPDGVNASTGLVLICTGAARADQAGGLISTITSTAALPEIVSPYVQLSASISGGVDATAVVDIYPLFEKKHPNVPVAGVLS